MTEPKCRVCLAPESKTGVENSSVAPGDTRPWRTSDGMYEVDGIPYNVEISSCLGNDWTLCDANWKPLEKPLSAWSLVGHEWRLHLKHSSGRRWTLTTLREERTLTAQQHRELIFQRLDTIGDIALGTRNAPDRSDGNYHQAVGFKIPKPAPQTSLVNGNVAPGPEVAELCVKLLTSWMPCNSKWEIQPTYTWERVLWKAVRSECNTCTERLVGGGSGPSRRSAARCRAARCASKRWAIHLRQADGKQLTLFHPEHEVDWSSWIDRIARGDFVELHPHATTLSEEDVLFGNHVCVNFGRSDFCLACTEVFWEGLPNVVLGDSDGAPMYANECGDCWSRRLIDAECRRRAADLLPTQEPPSVAHSWEAWETAFWSEP